MTRWRGRERGGRNLEAIVVYEPQPLQFVTRFCHLLLLLLAAAQTHLSPRHSPALATNGRTCDLHITEDNLEAISAEIPEPDGSIAHVSAGHGVASA
eukprot:1363372-Rhodomonas_salina.3